MSLLPEKYLDFLNNEFITESMHQEHTMYKCISENCDLVHSHQLEHIIFIRCLLQLQVIKCEFQFVNANFDVWKTD